MKTGHCLSQEAKSIQPQSFASTCQLIARQFLKKWWWVFVFSFSSTLLYAVAYNEKRQIYTDLHFKIEEMKKEKIAIEQTKEDVLLKISSQEDPAWIEMMLMRDLGVVPDGWLKVHFEQ